MEQPQLKVQVICMTFNHAPYVIEAMNGFCLQQTTFPFICTIFDDCSTDGEQAAIRQYLQENFDLEDKCIVRNEETDDYLLTFAQHKENKNCFFAVYYLKYNHYSIGKNSYKNDYCKGFTEQATYIALCEGDDYWTDPLKLQKQVYALEDHQECTICFSKVRVVSPQGEYLGWNIPVNHFLDEGIIDLNGFTYYQFKKKHWVFHTSSYVYRSLLQDEIVRMMQNEFSVFPYADTPIVLICLMKGNGVYIDEEIGCYRWQSIGSWTERNSNDTIFKVNAAKQLIDGLKVFDKITDKKYHVNVQTKILQQNFLIDEYSNNVIKLLHPKYWRSYNIKTLKHILSVICTVK